MLFVSWLLLHASPRVLRSFLIALCACRLTIPPKRAELCPSLHLANCSLLAKTKPTYTSASPRGGQWTIALLVLCTLLTITELRTWWSGEETHHFTVERGVSHELQLNLDVVVAMRRSDLHVNVQDAAMDRILAGDLLTKDDTNWQVWTDKFGDRRRRGGGAYKALHEKDKKRQAAEEEDQRVGHVLGHMREGGKKFEKTPRLARGQRPDSCRIFGSLEGNKVQGDFHITARGHGYTEFAVLQHLDHTSRCHVRSSENCWPSISFLRYREEVPGVE